MALKMCILAFITLLFFHVETEAGSCCLSYTRQPRRCANLKGFDIQPITSGCDLPAIIFHTTRGKSICADPAQGWTKERVGCLKLKAENMKKIGRHNPV